MEKYNNKRNVIFNPNQVQKWNVNKNKIITVSSKYADQLIESFNHLRKTASDGYSDYQELIEANKVIKSNNLARIKKLELEKKAGYIRVSALTIIATLITGLLIFIAVGTLLGG